MTRNRLALPLSALLLALFTPTAAFAQGFAPQKGSVWLKLGYIYGAADEQFAGRDTQQWEQFGDVALGERTGFVSRQGQLVGGELFSHDVTLVAVWSPFDGVTTGLFVPMLRYVQYSNQTNNFTTRAVGPGDVKAYVGYQLTPRDQNVLGISAYTRLKIPTTFPFPYTNDALRGEGQVDVEFALENSVNTGPVLVNFGGTYRVRTDVEKDGNTAEVGDEIELNASIGGAPLPWVWLSGGWSGMFGQEWTIFTTEYGAPQERSIQREFQAVFAGAYLSVGQFIGVPGLAVDLWYKHPITGRDFTAIQSGGAGIAYGF